MTDPTVDLWALDEVHFQQHGSRCRMWIPAEVRAPILLHAPTRFSVGYFGAVRLRDGKFVSRQEPTVFDAATCWAFLKQLRHASARAACRVVVILDNANFYHARLHRAWRERCAGRFELFYLPPYRPDLNPCERVWEVTRRLCTDNRYFARLAEVQTAVTTQFLTWAQPNDALRRSCAII
jgi:hypothetical protein